MRAEALKAMLASAEGSRGGTERDEDYLLLVSDYYRRQLIVYENWPQRKYDGLGYIGEKVFGDLNA